MIQYPFLCTGTFIHSSCMIYSQQILKSGVPAENAIKVEPLDLDGLNDCPERTLTRPHTHTSDGEA